MEMSRLGVVLLLALLQGCGAVISKSTMPIPAAGSSEPGPSAATIKPPYLLANVRLSPPVEQNVPDDGASFTNPFGNKMLRKDAIYFTTTPDLKPINWERQESLLGSMKAAFFTGKGESGDPIYFYTKKLSVLPVTAGTQYVRYGNYLISMYCSTMTSTGCKAYSENNVQSYHELKIIVPQDAKAVYLGTLILEHDGQYVKRIRVVDDFDTVRAKLTAADIPGVKPAEVRKSLAVVLGSRSRQPQTTPGFSHGQ